VTKLTACDRLHAVVGGFHLGAPRFEPLIGPTCEAFLRNSVGTRFEFEGTDERA
jgi:metal-dependent hydrolase (beta-lactamase superfamily II)